MTAACNLLYKYRLLHRLYNGGRLGVGVMHTLSLSSCVALLGFHMQWTNQARNTYPSNLPALTYLPHSFTSLSCRKIISAPGKFLLSHRREEYNV
jgi:hypothetical protein